MEITSGIRSYFYPLIGLVIGVIFAYALEVGLFETWHSLGKPAELTSRIIGANENAVYVLSTSGKTYSYTYFQPGNTLTNRWEEEIPNAYKIRSDYDPAYFITLPPLFKVIQDYEVNVVPNVEAGGQVKIVLSEDGTVWIWKHISLGMGVICLPIFPILGLGIGTLAMLLAKKRAQEIIKMSQ